MCRLQLPPPPRCFMISFAHQIDQPSSRSSAITIPLTLVLNPSSEVVFGLS